MAGVFFPWKKFPPEGNMIPPEWKFFHGKKTPAMWDDIFRYGNANSLGFGKILISHRKVIAPSYEATSQFPVPSEWKFSSPLGEWKITIKVVRDYFGKQDN